MIIYEGGLDEGKAVWLKGLRRRESGTNEGERQMRKKAQKCEHNFEYVKPNPETGGSLWVACEWDEAPEDDFQVCFSCGQEAHFNG